MPFNNNKSIKVLLVQDQTLFAEGVVSLLVNEPRISVVGIAKDGQECISKLSKIETEVVLLDIGIPDVCGTDLIEKIKTDQPAVKIIMSSGQDPNGFVDKSIGKGANGFLSKKCTGKDMVQAIFRVAKGGVYFPQVLETLHHLGGLADIELTQVEPDNSSKLLTKRESETMELASRGKNNNEIASELGISVSTVKFHVGNSISKLGVSSRLEAALKIQELGIRI